MERNKGSEARYHVLIADDEPEIRSLLLDWLQDNVQPQLAGIPVVAYEAGNGNDAMAKVAECKAKGGSLDVAIVDLLMPGRSGFETIEDLLRVMPSTRIVVLSATVDFNSESLQQQYGAALTLLPKPVGLDMFADTVVGLLRGGNRYA